MFCVIFFSSANIPTPDDDDVLKPRTGRLYSMQTKRKKSRSASSTTLAGKQNTLWKSFSKYSENVLGIVELVLPYCALWFRKEKQETKSKRKTKQINDTSPFPQTEKLIVSCMLYPYINKYIWIVSCVLYSIVQWL